MARLHRATYACNLILIAVSLTQPSHKATAAETSIITTVAGGGIGDGGPATVAGISPAGLTIDKSGNLYIADPLYHRVRKIQPNGVITTVAGVGAIRSEYTYGEYQPTSGYSGDGGLATNAELLNPYDIAVDNTGNLFIVDTGNNRIRKVNPSGIISTIAGNSGEAGYSGDGPATTAKLISPSHITLDKSGNIYFVDGYVRVRRISPDGQIMTVAGNGIGGYSGDYGPAVNAQMRPTGVAVDVAGNMYITDPPRIRKVDSKGIITTLAGKSEAGSSGDGGPAKSALLQTPRGIRIASSGELFFWDGPRVRTINSVGIINKVAGRETNGFSGDNGPALEAQLDLGRGLTIDTSGILYVADTPNARVRKVTKDGIIVTIAGSDGPQYGGDNGPATQARLYRPTGIAVDYTGNIYVADNKNNRIRKVDTQQTIITVAGDGIQGFLGEDSPATSARLNNPMGLAIDAYGSLLITDRGNHVVRKLTSDGYIRTIAGTGITPDQWIAIDGDGGSARNAKLRSPSSIAVQPSGDIYITDNYIRKIDTKGTITTLPGGETYVSREGTSTPIRYNAYASEIAFDSQGKLYSIGVTPPLDSQVVKVMSDTYVYTYAGGAGRDDRGYKGDGGQANRALLFNPQGIAIDAAGNLFIADTRNNVIRKVTPEGIITTVAGKFQSYYYKEGSSHAIAIGGYAGDGGPPTEALLSEPTALAIDRDGNLYVADTGNNRIRKITGVAVRGLLAGEPFPDIHQGDINIDSKIDIHDAILILRIAVGIVPKVTDTQKSVGDMNRDGGLDVNDAVAILRNIVGL